jgi:hypothetical protein
MIPTHNPFRAPGKFEQFTASFMAENDKKPLLAWFDKFEAALSKAGTDYQKSKINPTDVIEYYYNGKSPEEAVRGLTEDDDQLDEYIKKNGDRRRCAGGDGRRKDNKPNDPTSTPPIKDCEISEDDQELLDFINQNW